MKILNEYKLERKYIKFPFYIVDKMLTDYYIGLKYKETTSDSNIKGFELSV